MLYSMKVSGFKVYTMKPVCDLWLTAHCSLLTAHYILNY